MRFKEVLNRSKVRQRKTPEPQGPGVGFIISATCDFRSETARCCDSRSVYPLRRALQLGEFTRESLTLLMRGQEWKEVFAFNAPSAFYALVLKRIPFIP